MPCTCRLLTSNRRFALRACPTGAALFIKPIVYKTNAERWAYLDTCLDHVAGRRFDSLADHPHPQAAHKDEGIDSDEPDTADSTGAGATDDSSAAGSTSGPA